MALNRDEIISSLNELIETCRDGEEGFRRAAESVQSGSLKTLFEQSSLQRGQFAAELRTEVRQLGGDAADSGSVAGSLHRGWIGIKSMVTGKDDAAILAECERGEDAAVESYQKILKENLPPNVLPVVKHQYTQIKQSHDRIRDLEKAA